MIFNSRRSPVYSTEGIVSTSSPLAAMAGVKILQQGGNAADAAVATAAALNVVEPTSTGLGGDCFALYYDAKTKTVQGLNGSGRAPKELSIEKLAELNITEESFNENPTNIHTVTVPGAAAGWVDTVDNFGTKTMAEILSPALRLAEEGFSVSPITAYYWTRGASRFKPEQSAEELLLHGRAPQPGQLMRNLTLANTFKQIAEFGKSGYYEGRIAESIVDVIQSFGGFMTMDDLKNHSSTLVTPISTNYKGYEIYEIPPNGQGLAALLALNIVEEFDISKYEYGSPEYYHLLIEAMRLAFADTRWYVADMDFTTIPMEELLSKSYAKQRAELINLNRATIDQKKGSPITSSDTVYLSVVDKEGNACSFINSNYMGFGTGIIPVGCGFTLQNRGACFSLDPSHPNALQPNKRPYHTIIPSMITKDSELYASFGVMGGFMQPQGHMQVAMNLIDHHMNPQEALDAPRFCITDGQPFGTVALEDGISLNTMSELASFGHNIRPRTGHSRSIFGRGQVITRNVNGILTAGSDPRADGMAIPVA